MKVQSAQVVTCCVFGSPPPPKKKYAAHGWHHFILVWLLGRSVVHLLLLNASMDQLNGYGAMGGGFHAYQDVSFTNYTECSSMPSCSLLQYCPSVILLSSSWRRRLAKSDQYWQWSILQRQRRRQYISLKNALIKNLLSKMGHSRSLFSLLLSFQNSWLKKLLI